MTAELDDLPFATVRRGYDRTQVEEHLSRLRAELAAAVAARDTATEDLRRLDRQLETSRDETQAGRAANAEARAELDRLRAHVAELSTIPSTVDGMSERLQQMVRIAQDEVNDMRSRATANAAHVLNLAQAEADELAERSKQERRDFETKRLAAEDALRSQTEESRARLEQLRSDSDGQQARLDAELSESRTRAVEGLAAEMEQRRSAVLGDLAALEARQHEAATRIVDTAAQEARTLLSESNTEAQRIRAEARNDVDAAHREFDEVRALQYQVSEQLTSVRALLDWTLPQIGTPAPRPSGHGGVPPAIVARAPAAPARDALPEPTAETSDDEAGKHDAATAAASAGAPAQGRPTPTVRHPRIPTPPAQAGAHP